MAYEPGGQPFPLVRQRLMAVVPTPVADRGQRAGEPALGGPLAHHVLALLRFHPSVGEAEKVERRFLAVRVRATLALGAEVDEARLVGMERKPLPAEPLPQHIQHPLGVVVVLERHHEVVGKPNQAARPPHAGSHFVLEPLIQHMAQENVRESSMLKTGSNRLDRPQLSAKTVRGMRNPG